jgi:Holliday junction resolvase RusA-like endonuclease
MTRIVIPGKPFAKQRPRATRQGRVYTPAETVSFERQVGQIAAQYFPKPIDGPVSVTIRATFEPPKSWSKRKTAEHINGPHTQKPDLDNCAKAILDGLNRIAWADDGQVAEVTVSKVWGPSGHTVVHVEEIST